MYSARRLRLKNTGGGVDEESINPEKWLDQMCLVDYMQSRCRFYFLYQKVGSCPQERSSL